MAKKPVNKIYTIFMPIALVLAGVIFFFPTQPKQTVKTPYYQQTAIVETSVSDQAIVVEGQSNIQTTQEASGVDQENKTQENKGKESKEIERRIRRDIFSLDNIGNIESLKPLKTSEETLIAERPKRVSKIRERPSLDIRGIMIADNENKSIILGNGRIMKENERIEGYTIKKIESAKVTLVSDDNKDTITVKVWEE